MTERESIIHYLKTAPWLHVPKSMGPQEANLLRTIINAIESEDDKRYDEGVPLTAAQLAEQGFVLVPSEPSPWSKEDGE